MNLNANFDQRVSVHSANLDWQNSPMPGVKRRMLDRIGDEVARATTVVSYAPGSHFSPHVHTGGEEFLVLEGVFQDEHGDFPAGSYIRNPPQSRHTPGSDEGCIILVKLWQFDLADRRQVRTHIDQIECVPDLSRPGVSITPLYEDDRERVRFEYWEAGTVLELNAPGGVELFVLEGGFEQSDEAFSYHSWLRLPEGGALSAKVGPDGAKLWIKTGHLRFAVPPEVN